MKKFIEKIHKDQFFRTFFMMGGSAIFTLAYGIFSAIIGIIDKSPYMATSGAYYLILAVGEALLVIKRDKIKGMRGYGLLLLGLDVLLSIMTFYTLFTGRNTSNDEIVMITIALYSFVKMGTAINNLLKARHSQDTYFLIMRAISFSSALVGMLTLTMSMVATFGDGGSESNQALVIGTGLGVLIINFLLSIYLIINKKDLFKKLQQKED